MVKKQKNDRLLNRMLKIGCISLFSIIVVLLVCYTIKPLWYHKDMKTMGKTYDKFVLCRSLVERYVYQIKHQEYDKMNDMLTFVRRKSDAKYEVYASKLSKEEEKLKIQNIQKINGSDYLVTYLYDNENTNVIAIHFQANGQTVKIYYDQMLESL